VHALQKLFLAFRSRRKAHLVLAFLMAANQATLVALAAAPSTAFMASPVVTVTCQASDCTPSPQAAGPTDSHVSVPEGFQQCPGSGQGASCGHDLLAASTPGTPSTPDGVTACTAQTGKPVPASPAACSDPVAGSGPNNTSPSTPTVAPSLPQESLGTRWADQRLALKVSSAGIRSGQKVVLTATATLNVAGTNAAIEIVDQTQNTVIGACANGSQCSVAYATQGGSRNFAAYILPPTANPPSGNSYLVASNQVKVDWLGVTLSSDTGAVAPGHWITLTAKSTIDVAHSGHVLEIYDYTASKTLTYCSQGTTCSTSISMPNSAAHLIVGYISGRPDALSAPVAATWLSVSLVASTVIQSNDTVSLSASTNADLSKTPWSLGIYDRNGTLVSPLCKTGYTCSGASPAGNSPYTAVIGSPAPLGLAQGILKRVTKSTPDQAITNVQVRSASVEPARIIWGVDSCKAMTTDGTSVNGLYADVSYHIGAPGFWGRYLTDTVCPGISSAEVAIAHRLRVGILPIYNDYSCSAVSGYDTGRSYASAATAAASNLGIPAGRAIAIDIEPPGDACPGAANVDAGFVQGWYDGVTAAHYAPAYYGNGTAGSEFASAWCAAVSPTVGRPEIAAASYLWSFEPSLISAGGKGSPPAFSPYQSGCGGNVVAWQYMLGSQSPNPDIDMDEALTSLPLWFP
jgi:glycoside hydrolase-like protein